MGGILRTRMVCAMADAHYAVVAPHQAQGPIATAVCVQIGACTPNLLVQELFDEFNVDWEREIVTPPVQVVDGRIQIPDAPVWASTSTGPRRKSTPIRSRISSRSSPPAGNGARAPGPTSPPADETA